jgi:hypothetical protein
VPPEKLKAISDLPRPANITETYGARRDNGGIFLRSGGRCSAPEILMCGNRTNNVLSVRLKRRWWCLQCWLISTRPSTQRYRWTLLAKTGRVTPSSRFTTTCGSSSALIRGGAPTQNPGTR